MPLIEGKLVEEVFTREPRFQALTPKGKHVPEPDRTKYLRVALALVVTVTLVAGTATKDLAGSDSSTGREAILFGFASYWCTGSPSARSRT